ncbi:MAG TPA: YceI family protein [Jatrophihabitantaceae bacterium]|jgi:polyisoprenoid-binding protein YceI
MTGTLTDLRTGRWEHVAPLSGASFTVRNFAFNTVRGTVPIVSATVDVDADGVPVAVHATLDLTGIATGNPKRDSDLQKPHLMDTAEHPRLTFAGTPMQRADAWQVPGRLAGRAATDVTLDAQLVDRSASGELIVHATCTIDRRRLGVRAPRLLIGRYVAVTVTAVFAPRR